MGIDPNTAYWTAALVNMAVITCLVVAGIRAIRRERVRTHRRLMLSAATLVGLFLLSYPGKLWLLGREQLELWSRSYVGVLRFHEACVAAMVIGGGIALGQALRLGLRGWEDRELDDLPKGTRLHRRAGWTAAVGASLGILAASYVLQGMYAR